LPFPYTTLFRSSPEAPPVTTATRLTTPPPRRQSSSQVLPDEVGCPPGDRHDRTVEIAGNHDRQDRTVDDPQSIHPTHPQLRVDDVLVAGPHRAGAERVVAAVTAAERGVHRG